MGVVITYLKHYLGNLGLEIRELCEIKSNEMMNKYILRITNSLKLFM